MANPERTEVNMADDSKPDTRDTLPEMGAIIPAGHAREALVLATGKLARAVEEYTATCEAIARALDATVRP